MNPSRLILIFEYILYVLLVAIPLAFYPWSAEVTRVKTLIGFVLTIFLLMITGFLISQRNIVRWNRSPLQLPAFVLIGYTLISMTWSRYPWAGRLELFRILPGLMVLCILPMIGPTHTIRQRSIVITAWTGLAAAGYGLLQIAGLDPIAWGRPFRDGVFATFGHPNFLAPYLILAIAATSILFCQRSRLHQRILLSINAIILAICLVLTQCKAAFLSFFGTIFIFCFLLHPDRLKRYRIIPAMSILLAITLLGLLMPQYIQSFLDTNRFRIWTWEGTVSIVTQSDSIFQIIFGTGLGTFPILFPAARDPGFLQMFRHAENLQHAHCEYLETTVESGIIGCLILMWFFSAYFLSVWKKYRSQELDFSGIMISAAVSVILMHNLVCVNARWFSSWFMMLLFMGLTVPSPSVSIVSSCRKIFWMTAGIIGSLGVIGILGSWYLLGVVMSDITYFQAKQASIQDMDTAMAYYRRAMEWNPWNMPANYDYAFTLSQVGKDREALTIFRSITEHHPDYQRIHRNLAILLQRIAIASKSMPYLTESIREMEREIAIDNSGENHFDLAQLYELAGNNSKANQEYQIFCRMILVNLDEIYHLQSKRDMGDLPFIFPKNIENLKGQITYALDRIRRLDTSDSVSFLETLRQQFHHNPEISLLLKTDNTP